VTTHLPHRLRTRRSGLAVLAATGLATMSLGSLPMTGVAHAASSPDSRAQNVVQEAAQQKGDPYRYGADGPGAFDCSGLTKFVYHHVGVKLPHSSSAQYDAVQHVAKSHKRPGDLVFFYDDDGDIYHVGVFAGHGKVWAAPQPNDHVRKQDIWTDSYKVGRP